jgi:hypothetical protein
MRTALQLAVFNVAVLLVAALGCAKFDSVQSTEKTKKAQTREPNSQVEKSSPVFSPDSVRTVWDSEKVRALVDKARVEPGDGSTKLVRDIYRDDSLESYCVMVQLVAWFNDGSASETVTNNITKRGVKILPILRYALDNPNVKLGKKSEDLRREIVEECIEAIKKGQVIGYDE